MVVLLSGGLDSMVVAAAARQAGTLTGCVFVDYGHPAQVQEGWRAFAFCGARRIPLRVVHVFGLQLGDMVQGVGARVVPARNAILISAAANAAIAMGAAALAVGAIADDQADYVDCRPQFFAAMAAALGIPVVAPLIDRSKSWVAAEAVRLGLDAADSWSCYGAGPDPCNECPSCVARRASGVSS
jgi:7-cyano-7-deazaguanine synthase